MALSGKVALVTGASRGIDKGIALQLGQAGATVYITGRTLKPSKGAVGPGCLQHTAEEVRQRGGKYIPVQCDHNNESERDAVFHQILSEQGRLDILVNNAYSGVPALLENYGKPFWEITEKVWNDVNGVGLRNHYICATKAARVMVKQKSGLIVNVSSSGGGGYLFTPVYGIGKVACDRMAADCAIELRPHNVAFVSLWPGAVKTEMIAENLSGKGKIPKNHNMAAFEFGESTEFPGQCVVALATDPNVIRRTGKIFTTSAIAREFRLKDTPPR